MKHLPEGILPLPVDEHRGNPCKHCICDTEVGDNCPKHRGKWLCDEENNEYQTELIFVADTPENRVKYVTWMLTR